MDKTKVALFLDYLFKLEDVAQGEGYDAEALGYNNQVQDIIDELKIQKEATSDG